MQTSDTCTCHLTRVRRFWSVAASRRGYRGKAEQMGYQTVMEFALFGQDLIELKAQCPWKGDGNFAARCEVEFPNDSQRSINDYMLLARYRPLIEERKPDSQQAGGNSRQAGRWTTTVGRQAGVTVGCRFVPVSTVGCWC